jgi:tripartite-type tricarboxylate transporter receptor subunit TctC
MLAALALAVTGWSARPALAQTYPTHPITFVVPFTPGAGTDLVARMLGQELQEKLGQPVIIDNRPGAGTLIGATAVVNAPADGYTLFLAPSTTLAFNPSLYKKLPYDPVKDFAPIERTNATFFLLVVNSSLPVTNLKELIAWLQAQEKAGKKVSYASAGRGTPHHLFMELFDSMIGVHNQNVAYKGSIPALTDVAAGEVPLMIVDVVPALQMIKDGKIRPIAVTSAVRSPALPNVPTMQEAGLPGYEATGWMGVVMKAGAPKVAIDKINAVLTAYLKRPDVAKKFDTLGLSPLWDTPEEFAQYINAEREKWAKVIKDAGIKPE